MPSVAIVGGGFGGVGAAALLRRAGHTDLTLFERGERLGGVWQANTYPGAACDIPSHLYEYSFAPNPRWSRRYAPRPRSRPTSRPSRGARAWTRGRPPRSVGPLGRRAVGARDQRRDRTSPTSWSPRAGSSRCRAFRRCPGSTTSPAPRSTPRAGATTCRWTGKRVARDRHRLQRGPGRAGDRRGGRAPRRLPALARRGRSRSSTTPTRRARRRSSSASPRSSASTAPRSSTSTSSSPMA